MFFLFCFWNSPKTFPLLIDKLLKISSCLEHQLVGVRSFYYLRIFYEKEFTWYLNFGDFHWWNLTIRILDCTRKNQNLCQSSFQQRLNLTCLFFLLTLNNTAKINHVYLLQQQKTHQSWTVRKLKLRVKFAHGAEQRHHKVNVTFIQYFSFANFNLLMFAERIPLNCYDQSQKHPFRTGLGNLRNLDDKLWVKPLHRTSERGSLFSNALRHWL